MIGAMLLALMLWTGATAHASDMIECSSAAAESAFHLDGKDEPRPDDRADKSVHFHSGCSAHCLATPSESRALSCAAMTERTPAGRTAEWRAGIAPPLTLRPPIA